MILRAHQFLKLNSDRPNFVIFHYLQVILHKNASSMNSLPPILSKDMSNQYLASFHVAWSQQSKSGVRKNSFSSKLKIGKTRRYFGIKNQFHHPVSTREDW